MVHARQCTVSRVYVCCGSCLKVAKMRHRARRQDHDLSALGNHPLRSHGGLGEQRVPFLVSRPLTREYRERAETGVLRNYDIFDFALNGVE